MTHRFPEIIAGPFSHALILGCCAAAVLLLWTPLPAGATSVRITSLGGTGDYFEDDGNVLRWYGSLIDYPDRLVIQSGRFDLSDGYHSDWGQNRSAPGVGIHAALDQAGRWGTAAMYFHGQSQDSDPGTLSGENLEGSIALLYAHSLNNDGYSFFFRHAGDQKNYRGILGADTFEWSIDQLRTDLGGGLRLNLAEQAYLDLSGEIRRTAGIRTCTEPNFLLDTGDLVSWNNWGLRTRAFVGLNERLTLIPVAEYLREEHSAVSASAPPYDLDGHMWRLGMGLNFFPDTDHLLLVSMEYLDGELDNITMPHWSSGSFSWGEDRQTLACVLGFEARLKAWLSLRAASGYQHVNIDRYQLRQSIDWPDESVVWSDNSDHIPMSLGLGFHLQDIDLDLALNDRQPLPSAYFLYDPDQLDESTWLSLALRYVF